MELFKKVALHFMNQTEKSVFKEEDFRGKN